ncbi:hypothetical protein JCM10450v2_003709 [Rhodotorula kratochvilovae]
MAAAVPFARQFTRAALPLVPLHGFTADALVAASSSLPAAPQPLTAHTLNALFPSPPPVEPSSFSLKGLALGNGGRRSYSRQELIALARGEGTAPRDRERTGPARALVHEWLLQGRRDMVTAVRDSGLRVEEDALRFGMRARLAYNEPALDRLPQALALLTAPTSTYLSNPLAALPFPSPAPHLSHVAHIAQDLAKASGSEAQGTSWYTLRARLATIYALSELSLLAPSSASLPSSARIAAAQEYAETLFDQSARIARDVEGAGMFAQWVAKSWMGIGRSVLA